MACSCCEGCCLGRDCESWPDTIYWEVIVAETGEHVSGHAVINFSCPYQSGNPSYTLDGSFPGAGSSYFTECRGSDNIAVDVNCVDGEWIAGIEHETAPCGISAVLNVVSCNPLYATGTYPDDFPCSLCQGYTIIITE